MIIPTLKDCSAWLLSIGNDSLIEGLALPDENDRNAPLLQK